MAVGLGWFTFAALVVGSPKLAEKHKTEQEKRGCDGRDWV